MASEIDADASRSVKGRWSDRNGLLQICAAAERRSWALTATLLILDEAFGAGGSISTTADHHAIGTARSPHGDVSCWTEPWM